MKDRITQFAIFLKGRFEHKDEKANQAGIIENIRSGIDYRGTRPWTLIFASLMASIGMGLNEPIITAGALLLAPLTGPLAGMGLGVAIYDLTIVRLALRNLLLIIVLCTIVAFLYFLAIPGIENPEGWLVRTSPTIWDILISLFGGFAVVLAGHGRRNGFVIGGVALATALLSPLCLVGCYLALGRGDIALSALSLFVTNVFFVTLASFLSVRALRFKRVANYHPKQVRLFLIIGVCMAAMASLQVYGLIRKELFKARVNGFITKEIRGHDMFVIDREIDALKNRVWLVVYGDTLLDSALYRITTNKRFYGLHETDLRIRYSASLTASKDTTDRWAPVGEYNNHTIVLNEKELMMRQFSRRLGQYEFVRTNIGVYHEFNAIFGDTKELGIVTTQIHGEQGLDTAALIYFRQPTGAVKINHKQVEKWLKMRLNVPEVRVMAK